MIDNGNFRRSDFVEIRFLWNRVKRSNSVVCGSLITFCTLDGRMGEREGRGGGYEKKEIEKDIFKRGRERGEIERGDRKGEIERGR